jgi:hypothetical protein
MYFIYILAGRRERGVACPSFAGCIFSTERVDAVELGVN